MIENESKLNEIMNNKLWKHVKYEIYVNYVFCKLCKNEIYIRIENYVKYDQPYNERR